MVELLNSIGNFALLINVVALLIYQFVKPKRTAFALVMFIVCVINVLHTLFQHELEKLYGQEEYIQLVRYLWYFGYALSDFILVYFCIKVCEKKDLIKDKATNFILITYMLQGANQLLRYADRYIFETDFLGEFYRLAVSTLSTGVSIIAVMFVSSFLIVKVHKKIINKKE